MRIVVVAMACAVLGSWGCELQTRGTRAADAGSSATTTAALECGEGGASRACSGAEGTTQRSAPTTRPFPFR